MKKIIIIGGIFLSLSFGLLAQETSQNIIDKLTAFAGIERNFMLNKLKTIHGDKQGFDNFYLYVGIEWELYKSWGVLGTLGISPNKSDKIPLSTNVFSDLDLNNYYIKNAMSETPSSGDMTFQIGAFYRFKHKKWTFTPYLAYGANSADYASSLSYTLKEKGTNAMYNVCYDRNKRYESDAEITSFLSLQFRANYKFSPSMGLFLGISYRHYLFKPDFRGTLRDYYDQSLIQEFYLKGSNAKSLGISMGITL